MVSTRISLGIAFLSKQINASAAMKYIVHAEMVTATGKYLLSKISYQCSSELTLYVKTKEVECENIVDVLQRLAKAVRQRVELGYVFDSTCVELMEEEDEVWGSFTLGANSNDPELDAQEGSVTLETVLTPARTPQTQKRLSVGSRLLRKPSLTPKQRIKQRRFESRLVVENVPLR